MKWTLPTSVTEYLKWGTLNVGRYKRSVRDSHLRVRAIALFVVQGD